jgi:hypothetical protein
MNSRALRFLCLCDPYLDKKVLKNQRDYWKLHYDIVIKGDFLIDLLLVIRQKDLDDELGKVVIVRKGRRSVYTYPVECVIPNRHQTGYRIIDVK